MAQPEALKVQLLTSDAKIPTRASPGAAGYDLYAASSAVLRGCSVTTIPTGIAIALPDNVYGRIAPRSGLALHHCLSVGGGVIDGDYRGEIRVILFNHGLHPVTIRKGDRVAQLICEMFKNMPITLVNELDETKRKDGGFGSTGV